MPQRKCTKTKAVIASPIKRITLPITMEKYREIVGDCPAYRKWVDEMIVKYPELFPQAIGAGYTLHDERASVKSHKVVYLNLNKSLKKSYYITAKQKRKQGRYDEPKRTNNHIGRTSDNR